MGKNNDLVKNSHSHSHSRLPAVKQESLSCQSNLSCLGCTEFFYEEKNLLVREVTKTDLVALPSAKRIRLYEEELRSSLCGLMNGRGGVILFGCEEERGKVLIRGELVSEGTKESVLQQLIEVFETFSPKIIFSDSAHLSFVPVAF